VTTEAMVGVMHLQAREYQGLLATPEPEKARRDSLQVSEEVWPC